MAGSEKISVNGNKIRISNEAGGASSNEELVANNGIAIEAGDANTSQGVVVWVEKKPGAQDADDAASQLGKKLVIQDEQIVLRFESQPGARIVLPEGTAVKKLIVAGDDFLIDKGDGTYVLISQGVKHVPSLIEGENEMPYWGMAQFLSSEMSDGLPQSIKDGLPGSLKDSFPPSLKDGGFEELLDNGGGVLSGPTESVGDVFDITPLLRPTELVEPNFPSPPGVDVDIPPPVEPPVAPPNDFPAIGSPDAVVVDDEGLAGGIPGGDGDIAGEPVVVVGSLDVDFGDDGPGDINFAGLDGQTAPFTSEGQTVVYQWDQATHTLTAV